MHTLKTKLLFMLALSNTITVNNSDKVLFYFINVVYAQLDDLCYYTTIWELKQGNLHKPVDTSNKSRNIGHHANA